MFYLFLFLAVPWGLWDLSSLTRRWTWVPAVKALSSNHWTSREFSAVVLYKTHFNTTVYAYDIKNMHIFQWYELKSFTDGPHNEDHLEISAFFFFLML